MSDIAKPYTIEKINEWISLNNKKLKLLSVVFNKCTENLLC